jgi:hypothetical protein
VRALEGHYKATELAEQWSLSPKVVRKIFADEPGVLKVDRPELRNKRGLLFSPDPRECCDKRPQKDVGVEHWYRLVNRCH